MIDVGSKLAGYEVVARLRSGGMATLFLGRRHGAAGFSRHVAIKVVHPHLAHDPGFVRMFVDEAMLTARLTHPNVVHVEELGEADGTYFLVMEYVHGCALSDLLRALAKLERRLAPELSAWIAMRVLDGLHAAHELRDPSGEPLHVVHRDVSPQNVLISIDGNVKLIDFGIAKARGRQQRTATGALKGKLRYMSPEQAYGRPLDRRADVYAVGVVLWEMLTMRRMFTAENDLAMLDEVRTPKHVPPSELMDDVPKELDRAVLAALTPSADDRIAAALDFRRQIGAAVPRTAALDATHLAEVLDAVLGTEIEARRRNLPESLTGLSRTINVDTTRDARHPRVRDEIMREMTHSAPGGAKYAADDAGDAFQSQPDEPAIEAAPSRLAATRVATPSSRPPPSAAAKTGMSRDRKLAIAAVLVALLAIGGAAAFALTSSSSAPPPQPPASGPPIEARVAEPPPAETATREPPTELASPEESAATTSLGAEPEETGATSRTDDRPRGMRGMRAPQEAQSREGSMSLVEGVLIVDDEGI